MAMFRKNSPGLEFDFGYPHAIFNEQDFLRAAAQNVQAAFLVPLRLRGCLILQKLDCDIAKGR